MDGKQLKEKLYYNTKNIYEGLACCELEKIDEYAKGYMRFLDQSKTEREAVKAAIAMVEKEGYAPFEFGMELEQGGKYYLNNRGKALYVFAIGTMPMEEGIHIMASHIDSPRLDLKQNPLYENSGMGFLKTHYYGGIKKYQWIGIPLALHGTVIKADGTAVDVKIGDDPNDPVLYISDLLPHLAKDQVGRTLGDAFPGEGMNLYVGSIPTGAENADEKVKLHILSLLNEKYGIVEADFLSSELSAVPAQNTRYIGLDKSLIGGYGHDDRVCAYTSLTGFLEDKVHERTAMVILADKEETGSDGNTGMQCSIFMDLIDEMARQFKLSPAAIRAKSRCLSADVSAAYDPNYADVYEVRNNSALNKGVVVTKYTGSRGKSGTSDASAEFVGWVRRLFDEKGVIWQTSELGKVDQGGGGTVAMYIAGKNIDVVDVGVPVLSMHAPFEAISKADLYMTHKAFAAFN